MRRPRRLPPYTHAFVDRHGKPRCYFRRAGFPRVALPGLPWSPEFMRAYEAAQKGERVDAEFGARRTMTGTVNSAIVAYYNSNAFRVLKPSTQSGRRNILERFRSEHGEKRIATLTKRAIVTILAEKRPFAARNWLKTLRGLLHFAISVEMRSEDPSQGIKLTRAKSEGIYTWTEGDIKAFEVRHPVGTKAWLALSLMLYTAQRRSDIIRMGRQHVRNGAIAVRQEKTGVRLEIPLHPALLTVLDAAPSAELTFLTTGYKKPFTPAGFGNWFREKCDEAGLPQCSAHGLRKAACRRLAEAGCSVNQIAAISGHASISEVQRYTKAADQTRLAKDAMRAMQSAFPEAKKRTSSGKPHG